jgi:ABC-2 type transport system permease protein
VVVPKLVAGGPTTTRVRIGVTAAVAPDLRRSLTGLAVPGDRVTITVVTFRSEASGRRAVEDGSVDFLVSPNRLTAGRAIGDGDSSAASRAFAATAELLRLRAGLSEAGLNGAQADQVLQAHPPEVVRLQFGTSSTTDRSQFGLATAATVLMYLVLIFYGQAVAGGVNEEKSSRVVELLLSSMSSRQLLTGKVVGIGLVGLLQVVLVALTAGAAALVVGVDLPTGSAATVAGYVLWFVLGYALYCTLFAAAGALTSRPEEAQQAATPVFILLGLGYVGAFAALTSPDGGLATVLSFIPFSAPLVMPARAAVGSVPLPHVLLSMLLTVVAIVVANRLAGRVYEGAVLRFGPRIKVRQALRHDERVGRTDATAAPTT